MPVFGFVLTLDGDAAKREALLARLRWDSRVALEGPHGCKLAVALEVERLGEEELFLDELCKISEGLHADVVFSHFEDVVGGSRAQPSEPAIQSAPQHPGGKDEGEEDPKWR